MAPHDVLLCIMLAGYIAAVPVVGTAVGIIRVEVVIKRSWSSRNHKMHSPVFVVWCMQEDFISNQPSLNVAKAIA